MIRKGRLLSLKGTVVFIGFQEQDNLGIGYMTSVLLEEGYSVKIIDFRSDNHSISESLRTIKPIVVGFSIIFQHYLLQFKSLIDYLRNDGISCHFCAGGHYPSLRPVELFSLISGLNSIVLFEGEWTFLELVNSIAGKSDWRKTRGIAYLENNTVLINPLRPLEKDLDNFSPPFRPPLKEYALGKKFSTILAGRGCLHHCSFCSINEFYSKPPGPVKRVRLPAYVAREMELLFNQESCSVFMFQDDDFPLNFEKRNSWIIDFCNSLKNSGLDEKVMWKINCRPDEVNYDLFSLMKRHGLFLVYLGIESGNVPGLKLMNKNIKPSTNENAVRILKELDILYDYGFMLFDPESTFETVSENLDFLEKIISDGSAPITFCKMLPYAETKIENQLIKQGRLNGTRGYLDYNFHDKRLDLLFEYMATYFSDWIGDHNGLLNLARWTRYYLVVYEKYFKPDSNFEILKRKATNLVRDSNLEFFIYARYLTDIAKNTGGNNLTMKRLKIREEILGTHSHFCTRFEELINEIKALANRNILTENYDQILTI